MAIRAVVLSLLALAAVSAQTVQCPNPPGGTVTCEAQQFPICRVENGEVRASCKNVPQHLRSVDLELWILKALTGREFSKAELDSEQYQKVLRDGKLVEGGKTATFRVPVSSEMPSGLDNTGAPSQGKMFYCRACNSFGTCEMGQGTRQQDAAISAVRNLCGVNSACVQKAVVKCGL